MKNKKNIIFIVVSMIFVISFLLLNKTNNVRQIKVKELNYNVTYKEAFPDENLRRGVVLCIMRDKCKADETQYFRYDGNLELYDNSNFLTDSRLGNVITEDEIKAKEEEQLSKTDLNKIVMLVANKTEKNITSLQGIEYLPNIEQAFLNQITLTDVDFSNNKELKYLNIHGSKLNSMNLTQNLKLNRLIAELSGNDKNLDLSTLIDLRFLVIPNSGIKDIKLPNGIEIVRLRDNRISDITIPNTVREINLHSNKLTSIILSASIEEVNVSSNEIENITFNGNSLRNLSAFGNNIKNIVLPEGLGSAQLGRNKIETITLPNSLVNLNLDDNKISNITLPDNISQVSIQRNQISRIDLKNKRNITNLELAGNYLEDIDVSAIPNLRTISFGIKKPKDTIDFSNNTQLTNVSIHTTEEGKINSLDFSKQTNLNSLFLTKLGLTKLNIENNVNLGELYLSDNNLEKVDLSKNTRLYSLRLFNNNIKNFKTPSNLTAYTVEVEETRKLKVKKNSYVTIPDMIYNDQKFYLEDNSNYEKIGDKYVFKNLTTLTPNIVAYTANGGYKKVWWKYEIKVEAGEEDSFNPTIDQKDYTPVINEEIAVDKLKEMVTNLPTNIKNFEIISANTFSTKGDKKVKVRVTFSDDTFKEFDIDIKVYEEKYIEPTVKISSLDVELNEKKSLNINVTREYDKEESIDDVNLIKYLKDKPINYEYNNVPNGLTYDSNKISGVIDYNFLGNEKEKVFNITYKENGNSYSVNKTIKVKLIKEIIEKETPKAIAKTPSVASFKKANKRVRRSLATYNEVNETVQELETLITKTKNDSFENKETNEVENLKNNILVKIEKAKEKLKKSYTEETEEEKLQEVKEKVLKEIDNLKEELNKVRDRVLVDKTKLNEKIKELEKAIKNKQCSNNDCKESLEKAKKIYNQTNLTKEEVNESINKITNLLEVKENNSKSFNYLYLLLLLPLIIFIFIILKKRKKENKKM